MPEEITLTVNGQMVRMRPGATVAAAIATAHADRWNDTDLLLMVDCLLLRRSRGTRPAGRKSAYAAAWGWSRNSEQNHCHSS